MSDEVRTHWEGQAEGDSGDTATIDTRVTVGDLVRAMADPSSWNTEAYGTLADLVDALAHGDRLEAGDARLVRLTLADQPPEPDLPRLPSDAELGETDPA